MGDVITNEEVRKYFLSQTDNNKLLLQDAIDREYATLDLETMWENLHRKVREFYARPGSNTNIESVQDATRRYTSQF